MEMKEVEVPPQPLRETSPGEYELALPGSWSAQIARALQRALENGERVLLMHEGEPVAGVIPAEDVRILNELEDRMDLEASRAALAEAEEEGTIPLATVKAELGLP